MFSLKDSVVSSWDIVLNFYAGFIPVSGTVDVTAPLQDSAVPEDVKAFESLVVEGLGEKGAGVSLRQEETRAV